MKNILLLVLAIALFNTNAQAQEDKKAKAQAIKDFSYSYGYRFGESLEKREGFEAAEKDPKMIAKGLKAGITPDSSTLAKLEGYVDERVADTSYEVTAENGKKMAYNLGYMATGNIIYTFELPSSDFHYASLKKGFWDFTKKKTPKLEKEKMEKVIEDYFQKMQEEFARKEKERQEKVKLENAKKSKEFLEANAKKEGVKTTASGLQYLVLQEGTGANPKLTDKVKVHYHGTLINGKVFDSSVDRGEPISFPLSNLIQGWQEGIPLMKVGAKYRLFIPSNLAYGDNAPPSIGPGQALIFDIELLEIEQAIVTSSKENLSYSYGYMVGKSLEKVNLTDKETNVQGFVAGIAKGFEATEALMADAEKLLTTRIQQNTPAVSDDAAQGIAFSIGYTSSGTMALRLGSKMEDFDLMKIGEGYETAKAGQEPYLNMEQMNKALQAYFEPKQRALQEAQQKQDDAAALVNIEAGAKFLEENGKKEGVVTLPSGLQYQILTEGKGEKPTLQSKVSTHYHGTLIDGTVFDSSVERGQPASFPVGGVIKGWTEALQLMPVGSKWRLFVPYNLAYGTRAMGPKIPAGSTLIFDVELLEIVK